jgi:hypothetical protein
LCFICFFRYVQTFIHLRVHYYSLFRKKKLQKKGVMESREVSHDEVLDAIYTFLAHHGYESTLRALQLETRRPFPVVCCDEDTDAAAIANLRAVIMEGKWDLLLVRYLHATLLPRDVMIVLFEHMLMEVLYVRNDPSAAQMLFSNAPVFDELKRHAPAHHARLAEEIQSHLGQRLGEEIVNANTAALIGKRGTLADVLCRVLHPRTAEQLARSDDLPSLLFIRRYGVLPSAAPKPETRDPEAPQKRPRSDHTDEAAAAPPIRCQTRGLQGSLGGRRFIVSIAKELSFSSPSNCAGSATVTRCARVVYPCHADVQEVRDVLVCAQTSGVVSVVGATDNQVYHTIGNVPSPVTVFALDAGEIDAAVGRWGGVWWASGHRDGSVRIYDLDLGKLVRKFDQVHKLAVIALAFIGSREVSVMRGHMNRLVSGSFDGNLLVLDVEQGAVVQRIDGIHSGQYVNGLCRIEGCCGVVAEKGTVGFDPKSRINSRVISCGNDGRLRLWAEMQGGDRKWILRETANPCATPHNHIPSTVHALASSPSSPLTGCVVIATRSSVLYVAGAAKSVSNHKLIGASPEHDEHFLFFFELRLLRDLRVVSACCFAEAVPAAPSHGGNVLAHLTGDDDYHAVVYCSSHDGQIHRFSASLANVCEATKKAAKGMTTTVHEPEHSTSAVVERHGGVVSDLHLSIAETVCAHGGRGLGKGRLMEGSGVIAWSEGTGCAYTFRCDR